MTIYLPRHYKGSFYGLIIGFLVGAIRFIWLSFYDTVTCSNEDKNIKTAPPFVNMHFLHFAIFSFVFTCFIIMIISLFTRPIPDKYIEGLTFFSKTTPQQTYVIPSGKGWGKNHFCAATNLDATDDGNDAINEEVSKINQQNTEQLTQAALEPVKKIGFFKKSFFFVCGIENEIKKNDPVSQDKPLVFDDPDTFWSKICDFSAVAILSATCFIIAFFNKYN